MIKKISQTLTVITLLLPTLAFARGGQLVGVSTVSTSAGVLDGITTITNWIFSGFLMIAVIMILIAAFNFLMAGGNAEKFGDAKKAIFYAMIAVMIAVLARSIVVISAALVGGSVTFTK